MKVSYDGDGKMFLHTKIGEGTMPDGRECKLVQTNQGIHMQVYSKEKNGGWKTFTVNYMDLIDRDYNASVNIYRRGKELTFVENLSIGLMNQESMSFRA